MPTSWPTRRPERRPEPVRRVRCIGLLLALILLAGPAAAEPTGWRRGINMGDYLAYPSSDTWPIFRGPRANTTDAELRRLASLGIDFIRLAVEPLPFITRRPGEVRDSEQRLIAFIAKAHAAGLKVMITGWARHESATMRPQDILASISGEPYRAYVAFLKRVIEVTRGARRDMLALEPMNEPQPACTRDHGGPDWAVIQRELFKDLRAAAPDLTLVLTTGCWSRPEALANISLGHYDRNILVDVHYYEPWTFTHQGATWSLDWIKSLAGLSFPPGRTDKQAATDASARLFVTRRPNGSVTEFQETLKKLDEYRTSSHGPERIAADMRAIADWARTAGISPDRMIVGEFGVLRQPAGTGLADDDGSRMRWLTVTRTAAEAAGLGWAHFAYHAEFGLVTDDANATLDPAMLAALGLGGL